MPFFVSFVVSVPISFVVFVAVVIALAVAVVAESHSVQSRNATQNG